MLSLKKTRATIFWLMRFSTDVALLWLIITIGKALFEDSTPQTDLLSRNHSTLKMINTHKLNKQNINFARAKIELYSRRYIYEAKIRGINIVNPIFRYKFSFYEKDLGHRIVGYCSKDNNTIYLRKDFNFVDFLHELGHCDFGYSHLMDNSLIKGKHSKFIMNWRFDDKLNGDLLSGKHAHLLDYFFNESYHHRIHSYTGSIHHHIMEAQVFIFDNYNWLKTKFNAKIATKEVAKK